MPAAPYLTSRLDPPATTSATSRSHHRRFPRTASRVVVAALMLASAACGRSVEVPDFRGTGRAEPTSVQVDVRNLNYADVTVHASRDSGWYRIGQVTGNSDGTLEVPAAIGSPAGFLRLRVHAIGSSDASDYVTDAISAGRGDVVVLRVAPVLRMSSWSVR